MSNSNQNQPRGVNDIGEDPPSPPPAGRSSPTGAAGAAREDENASKDSGDIGGAQMPAVQEQAPVSPPANDKENSDPNRGAENQAAENPAPAEDKGQAEKEKAMTKTTSYIDKNNFVARHRSNLLTMADWHQLEQEHLAPIKSGSGIIGKTKINLAAEKKKILEQKNEQKPLPQDDVLIERLREDGCFVDSAILFKNKDINIQKLEERLLNSGQKVYFKINGELKINNDLLAEELTRPADLAFEQTDAFQTVQHNSIVTDRLNSFKKRYYRIDIIIGKMLIKKYAQLFSAEDQMMVDLKFLCKEYDRRCDMALLPFYMDRLEFLREELHNKQQSGNMSDEKFLETMIHNIEEELEKEKAYLKAKSQEIYDLWLKIRAEQVKTGKVNTFYKLKVYQGPDDMDVLYNLQKQNDEIKLEPETLKRKQNTQRTQVQCILRIDDVEVARTNKAPINWPSYEVDILDQFQIHVFTLPSKIQLDVQIDNNLVDRIDLDVPGNHVKSLTSASRLLKEYEFGKRKYHIQQQKLKGNPDLSKDVKLMTPQEKAFHDKQEPIMAKNELDGTIFVKAEWDGFGDQMPPARSETLICSAQNEKNRRHFSKMEQHQMLKEQKPLDVNDPRNELLLKEMSKMKNNYLDRLLHQDAKFQLHDVESFRHQLMEARKKDPSYASVTIPQLGSELVNGDISKFYLEWLEDVHRKEAYKQYLDKKQAAEESNAADIGSTDVADDRLFDIATLKRRQEIYEKINTRRKQAQNDVSSSKQVQYDSVIDEVQLAPDRSLLATLKAAFTFQRKLKPKIRAKPAVSVDTVGEAKLLINVLRATDVPVRHSYYMQFIEYIKDRKDTHSQEAFKKLYDERQVEPYVEVRLVDPDTGLEQTDRTACAEGQCPEWNQMLEFALKAAKGKFFSQSELEQNRMMIYITLFDKETVEEPISKNKSIRYEENKYLGQIKIPLTTILSGSKFEGLVRLQRPLVLQNYHVVKDDLSFMNREDFERSQARSEEQVPTYLNVTISLDPPINIPLENDREFYVGAENGPFLEKGTAWEKQFYERFKPNPRQVKAFLENIEGKSTFIPRFLSPIKPPENVVPNIKDEKAIERCARFVSLIPYVDDSQLFKDMPDLTCNSQEFLDLGQGDSEEHAMLLCNYFNYLDLENGRQQKPTGSSGNSGNATQDFHSYIVYGEAVPNGFCWFVARCCRKSNRVREIWNPMNAECYDFGRIEKETQQVIGSTKSSTLTTKLFDPVCTMKKIWCVVGQENVWANIQEFESPALLDFDFFNDKLWQPFLTKSMHREHFGEGVMVQSQHRQVNAPEVEYTKPRSPARIAALEQEITKFITGKFEDERIKSVKKTTSWNLALGEQLEHVLSADPGLVDAWKDKVEEQMHPNHAGRSRRSGQQDRQRGSQWRGAENAFNPNKIPYEKYFIGEKFKEVLVDFEDYMACARMGGTGSAALAPAAQHRDEDIRATIVQNYLKRIAGEHQRSCWAVPLNCTLTSLENLWEMVKNTRVHEIDNQDIEFSLSVKLRAYPCNVISVWLYIAAFRPGDDLEDEDYEDDYDGR